MVGPLTVAHGAEAAVLLALTVRALAPVGGIGRAGRLLARGLRWYVRAVREPTTPEEEQEMARLQP